MSLSGISCYISSYKIQTYYLPTDNAHLKSWKLYAGNSEDDLHVIHFQNETQVLNNVSALVIINLSNIYGPFSIFRVQTVSTHYYSEEYFHVLRLAEFDIYGYSTGHDCQTKNHFTLNISPSSFLIAGVGLSSGLKILSTKLPYKAPPKIKIISPAKNVAINSPSFKFVF